MKRCTPWSLLTIDNAQGDGAIAGMGTDAFHVSVDVDCIDPKWAPGVSTPVKKGLIRRDILEAMRILGKDEKLDSIDIAASNPRNDVDDRTAKLVAEMIKMIILQKKSIKNSGANISSTHKEVHTWQATKISFIFLIDLKRPTLSAVSR